MYDMLKKMAVSRDDYEHSTRAASETATIMCHSRLLSECRTAQSQVLLYSAECVSIQLCVSECVCV